MSLTGPVPARAGEDRELVIKFIAYVHILCCTLRHSVQFPNVHVGEVPPHL